MCLFNKMMASSVGKNYLSITGKRIIMNSQVECTFEKMNFFNRFYLLITFHDARQV